MSDASTFLFADLAGYTALTEAHGDEQAADVAADFCEAVRRLLPTYDAHEVKAVGDALLVRIPDAAGAVHLGSRIVGDLGHRHESLSVRVGMHTGTAVQRGGDWFGTAVNVASRVADLAEPCEVLLTAATRSACADVAAPGLLVPRGRRALKNVRDPIELWAVATERDAPGGALAIDPVCRMALDPRRAAARIDHEGALHHFCSNACAEAFERQPGRFRP
jgi:adenylate cyclase